MLLYVTLTVWTWYVTYFWLSILSLCIAPFFFNPHQFSFSDFIIDYRYVFPTQLLVRDLMRADWQGVLALDVPWKLALT